MAQALQPTMLSIREFRLPMKWGEGSFQCKGSSISAHTSELPGDVNQKNTDLQELLRICLQLSRWSHCNSAMFCSAEGVPTNLNSLDVHSCSRATRACSSRCCVRCRRQGGQLLICRHRAFGHHQSSPFHFLQGLAYPPASHKLTGSNRLMRPLDIHAAALLPAPRP